MEVKVEFTQFDEQGRPIEAVVRETGKQARFVRGTPEELKTKVMEAQMRAYGEEGRG
jgi:hypothetical protein